MSFRRLCDFVFILINSFRCVSVRRPCDGVAQFVMLIIIASPLPSSSADVSRVLLQGASSGSKLKRPTLHSSRGSLTGENGGTTPTSKTSRTGRATGAAGDAGPTGHPENVLQRMFCCSFPDPKRGGSTVSGPTSRAGSRAGSRASSRRGSDASDASELQDARSVCSDTSDTPRRPGSGAKPSKIPTISKKAPSPKTTGSARK